MSSQNQLWSKILLDGVWTKNPALIQLLGLCPLLAVSATFVNALGLSLATLVVIIFSNLSVSLVRNLVDDTIRLPVFVMIIASFTTAIELLMQAFVFELYSIIGIFVPLIVTNCMILGRAEAFARSNKPLISIWDGIAVGVGFGLVLVILGTMRELLSTGTIFADMHLLLGANVNWQIDIWQSRQNMLLMVMPAGAFIICGLLIAVTNLINRQISKWQQKSKVIAGSKRVRTTDV